MSQVSLIPRFRFLFCLVATAVLSISFATISFTQSVEVDRAQLVRNQPGLAVTPSISAQGLTDGHAAPSPNDPDLGEQQILKRAEEYEPFTFSVGSPFYYTSNVALTKNDEHGDFLVAPAAALSYDPRFSKTFFGHFGVRQQVFLYDRFDEFNFASFDVDAGISYYLPQWHNLALHAGYVYTRFTNTDDFDEFFSNHALSFNAEIPFRLSRAQQISLGAEIDISIAGDPDGPRRDEFGVYLAYSVSLTRSLSLSAAGRVTVRDYVPGDRVDVSEMLALTVNYQVAKWLTASAIGSLAASQSNHSVFDYKVGNVGGAVSLSVKF